MPALIDITNCRFGRLIVLRLVRRAGYNRPWWHCRCDCGSEITVRGTSLKTGNTRSCGCLYRQGNAATHGHTRNRTTSATYKTWQNMVTRCSNPDSTGWENYGGRGITVCERWRNSFKAFLEDVGERPPGKSIDRIDNNGNYEPGNVKWSTRKEQNKNKRPYKNRRSIWG